MKCDERKPSCLRCEKSRTKCPGYRDLNDVLFRDESERAERLAREGDQGKAIHVQNLWPVAKPGLSRCTEPGNVLPPPLPPKSPPATELGASFFFAKYSYNESPYYVSHQEWLANSYLHDSPDKALRAAIEAVGIAGISNLSPASYLATCSREKYCKAVLELKEALKDPVQAAADSTLMTVFLLGLFEVESS